MRTASASASDQLQGRLSAWREDVQKQHTLLEQHAGSDATPASTIEGLLRRGFDLIDTLAHAPEIKVTVAWEIALLAHEYQQRRDRAHAGAPKNASSYDDLPRLLRLERAHLLQEVTQRADVQHPLSQQVPQDVEFDEFAILPNKVYSFWDASSHGERANVKGGIENFKKITKLSAKEFMTRNREIVNKFHRKVEDYEILTFESSLELSRQAASVFSEYNLVPKEYDGYIEEFFESVKNHDLGTGTRILDKFREYIESQYIREKCRNRSKINEKGKQKHQNTEKSSEGAESNVLTKRPSEVPLEGILDAARPRKHARGNSETGDDDLPAQVGNQTMNVQAHHPENSPTHTRAKATVKDTDEAQTREQAVPNDGGDGAESGAPVPQEQQTHTHAQPKTKSTKSQQDQDLNYEQESAQSDQIAINQICEFESWPNIESDRVQAVEQQADRANEVRQEPDQNTRKLINQAPNYANESHNQYQQQQQQ